MATTRTRVTFTYKGHDDLFAQDEIELLIDAQVFRINRRNDATVLREHMGDIVAGILHRDAFISSVEDIESGKALEGIIESYGLDLNADSFSPQAADEIRRIFTSLLTINNGRVQNALGELDPLSWLITSKPNLTAHTAPGKGNAIRVATTVWAVTREADVVEAFECFPRIRKMRDANEKSTARDLRIVERLPGVEITIAARALWAAELTVMQAKQTVEKIANNKPAKEQRALKSAAKEIVDGYREKELARQAEVAQLEAAMTEPES